MSTSKPPMINRPGVSIETMLNAIAKQADLIPGVANHVRPQVHDAVSRLALGSITNIFISGCGDSLYSALATRYAIEKHSGFRVEAIEALEFSRYTVDYLPKGSLVISISAGGDKSRSVEALRLAKQNGAVTIALTGTQGSPLTKEADQVIFQNEKEFRAIPPDGEGTFAVGNYIASAIVLYHLGFELGRVAGKLDQKAYEDLISTILRAPKIIHETIAAHEQSVMEFAKSVKQAPAYYILGGGPSYATALFMAAKLFEMPQLLGVPVELEEWAHEQYFLTRPGTALWVIAPPGNSIDRIREQMLGAKDMGARIVAVCDQNDVETQRLADVAFPITGELPEEFSPLTYCVPGELFAVNLSRALGKKAFAFITPLQYEVNMRQIRESHERP